jgi:hypothetical protein
MKIKKLNSRKMPVGAGKSEIAIKNVPRLMEKSAPVSGMIILHREEIEAGDQPGLMERLGPLAPAQDLSVIAGSTILALDGYADSPREIYEIPEVRHYFKVQNQQWSPWVFAGSVWTADLFAIVLACLPSVIICRHGDELTVRWDTKEMHAFFERSLPTAAMLHSRADISNEEGYSMLKATAGYLGLPSEE